MTLKLRPPLRNAALAALATVACYFTAPAMAADAAAAGEELQEVVITGSILRRTDTETPSVVSVLTAEDLQTRGINTVAEAVQRLSANGSGAITQGWNNGNNFATGANAVSLRGLTVQTTLTMFDGLRMAPYPLADDGHRNFVDLNTIPDAVIERIEVLKDGASSTYGADAIAGVVNVITKKEVTGTHLNAAIGTSARGGGTERRIDATWGTGKLAEQGYNFYVTGEYQKTDAIYARDRSYPLSNNNLSGVCDNAGHCLAVTSNCQFCINADGTLGAGTTTPATLVAPSSAAGTRVTGSVYQLLNPTAGCNVAAGLTPITLTAAQAGTTYATTQCSQDLRSQYQTLQPSQDRRGTLAKFTKKIGSNAEFYVMGSYYDVRTLANLTPLAFNSQTTAPRVVVLNPVVAPIYVCASGVGTINAAGVNQSSGCTASNGVLNPNNPFAANGQYAIIRARYDRNRQELSDARSLRFATGVSGTFGDSWNYSADFTLSNVRLDMNYRNWLIPQRIADVVAQGTYNFVNQSANGEAIRNYIAPDDITVSTSRLYQGQAILGKQLAMLPGGPLQAAVGAAYRKESIENPSANPDNIAAPYTRYYGVNAVGATGSRNVQSGFFEVMAPVVKSVELDAYGRYDKYSSGQTNFSPKFGAKWKPMDEFALRGTYAKGFRIPSFNESYGLPTTGYSTVSVNCVTYDRWCASHSPNGTAATANSYATGSYSLGTTATGNPSLNPEKSTSYTFGFVLEPIQNVSFTVDYWNIEVKDLISQVSAADRASAVDQYYKNNGVVNIPGITVTQGVADVAFPNALPLLGTINFSYNNADKENVSGIDFGVNTSFPVGSYRLSSSVDLSWLGKYTLTRKSGAVERYDGTLSPCDYTSCSGSPKLRGSFSNTLKMEKVSLTGTVYYTSGYNLAEVDYGGDPATCVANSGGGAGAPYYKGTTIPSSCATKPTWNFDMNVQYQVNDKVKLYLDALNILNIAPPFDPAAAYAGTQYNPAWAQANAIGRYFRAGFKLDF